MKRLSIIVAAIAIAANSYSQDSVKKDTAWKFGGMFALTISQASFTNWAAGGENSYSGTGRVGLFGNYIKGKSAWENNLDMAYGRANQGDVGLRKTDDLLELNSKYGYKASKKWYYTVVLNAKTQFDDGFDYKVSDSIVISKPLTPLYVNLGLGMDYKPNQFTSVFISPLNMKNIYVADEQYAIRYSVDSAQHLRTEVGALVKFKYEKEIIKNLNFLTKLDLFADYLEIKGVEDVDVNWEILLTLNVLKVLSINLNTNLIWDNDVRFSTNNPDKPDETTEKLQFKEIFGAGIAYKF